MNQFVDTLGIKFIPPLDEKALCNPVVLWSELLDESGTSALATLSRSGGNPVVSYLCRTPCLSSVRVPQLCWVREYKSRK